MSVLQEESNHRLDVIAGSGALRCESARLLLRDTEPVLDPEGVTISSGVYNFKRRLPRPGRRQAGVPVAYLKRMHAEIPELFDENVNTLPGRTDRRFLVRARRNLPAGAGLQALSGFGSGFSAGFSGGHEPAAAIREES